MVAAPAPAAFAPAHVKVRVARPVEGCALKPSAQLRSSAGHEDGITFRWRWLRSRNAVANCAAPGCPIAHDYDPVSAGRRRSKALQCAICAKEAKGDKSAPEPATFCSPACFVAAWPAHKRTHKPPRERSASNASSDVCAPSAGTSKDLVESQTVLDDDKWESVGEDAEYLPGREDIGRRLRVECLAMRTVNGEETLRARGAVSTEPVLQSPRAAPSRQWLGESTEGQDALRVCSYNVLAEIYATAHAYPYCPRWALDGGYRCSLVVQELVDADADVVCLQEAQRDAFESYLEPAMKRAGYEALFTQKSREAMGAAGKVDGCATFWKAQKYRVAEQRELRFNDLAYAEARANRLSERDEHAYLTRLVKDNVAQLLVLEDYPAPGRRSRRLAVANTHLYSHRDFPDAKLWQSLSLIRQLDAFCNRQRETLPCIMAGDLNSGPDSSVYEFLATQGVSRGHPDLQPRHTAQGFPVNVLPDARQIAHRLPLVSSYASVLGVEPDFTNLTQQFRGTLDYIWYDSSAIRCAAVAPVPPLEQLTRAGPALPSPQYPSDHVALIADFVFLP